LNPSKIEDHRLLAIADDPAERAQYQPDTFSQRPTYRRNNVVRYS
jgi:hypothetical protein